MPFNRLTIDGSIFSGNERFATSCAFAAPDGSAVTSATALSAWAEGVRALLAPSTGYAGSLRTMIGTNGRFLRVRAYYYLSPGSPAQAVGESTGASISGSSLETTPAQIAAVASLNTGVPGRRTRGRMYWPCTTGAVNATGKWTGAVTPATFSQAVAQFLGAAADLVSSPSGFTPVVVSTAGGIITPVISVSAGDVLDTQRRRRDDLVESRTTTAIP